MGSSTIRTATEAMVISTKPTTNYNKSTYDRMQTAGTATQYSYIRFNNPVPRGGTVISVKLHMFGYGNWGASAVSVAAARIASSWVDTKLTYNNRPGITGSAVVVSQTNPASGTEWVFDVTAIWQAIANGSAPNYGLRLSTSDTTQRAFYGLLASQYKPYLTVVWSDAPKPPVEMSPAGGASTTLSKPTLTFNFYDVSGSTRMGSCQVQINPTNSFTSPAFDSGEVVTSDPELDLTTTSYAGLAVGSTAWWRVRVKDAAGLWSGWSDPVNFKRSSRGNLTLNSPTGSNIEDSTQLVIWSLSGATQTSWQVIVEDDNTPGRPIYDSGRRAGADTSMNIPKHIITHEDRLYRLTVRTWDDLSRTNTPGDKIHTEVVNTFTFFPGTAADTVTNMQAIGRPSRQPGVYIRWDRDNAPDSFEIRRADYVGGTYRVLDTDLDPADLSIGPGSTYQYLDRTARPETYHDWRVISKIAGLPRRWGPVLTAHYTLDTTWLEDVDTGKLVPILFRSGSDGVQGWDAPQIGVVAQPNGAKRVIRITQGQAGLQGSVTGVLTDSYGGESTRWADNLAWMRDHPDNVLRLSTSGHNLSVVIGNVVIAPWASREDYTYNGSQVSFDFWQQ